MKAVKKFITFLLEISEVS